MIYTHRMQRIDCLSHEIYEAIEVGFKSISKESHFFWGLGEQNVSKITELEKNNIDWYYVDTGYLTEQITRYPSPKINDYDKTYFRIVKGGIHTISGSKKGGGDRIKQLEKKDIKCKLDNWNQGEGDHILVCPSSETVTYKYNGMTQGQWVDNIVSQIKKHTNRDIRIRNKPRPHNEWWEKPIQDDLDGAHCLITNMSLAAVDAVLEGVPVICDTRNVAWPVSTRYMEFINDPLKPTLNNVNEWLKLLANNQFTLKEIESGLALVTLSTQSKKVFVI